MNSNQAQELQDVAEKNAVLATCKLADLHAELGVLKTAAENSALYKPDMLKSGQNIGYALGLCQEEIERAADLIEGIYRAAGGTLPTDQTAPAE